MSMVANATDCPACGRNSVVQNGRCTACGAAVVKPASQQSTSHSSGYLPQVQLGDDFDPIEVAAHIDPHAQTHEDSARHESGPIARAVLILLLGALVAIAVYQIVGWRTPPTSAFVTRLDDKEFGAQILHGEPEQTWVVIFWSPRHARCREFTPIFNATAEDQQENASFASCKLESAPEAAKQFEVQVVPEVVIFRGGQAIERRPGFQTADELSEFLKSNLTPQN